MTFSTPKTDPQSPGGPPPRVPRREDRLPNASPSLRPERIVAPTVTFLAVFGLLIIARFYEQLPVQAPSCHFRDLTGFPCVGCGGTRAMKALSSGEILAAARLNPAVVAGVFATFAWFAWRGIGFLRGAASGPALWTRRRSVLVIVALGLLLAANWVYLLLHLK